jgi:hypothetical protein
MQKYLIDKDKYLAETILGRTEEIKSFNDKTEEEKIIFIKDILERLRPYLDAHKYGFADLVDKDDIYGIGTYYHGFEVALNVHLHDNYTVNRGWDNKHGKVFEYYENYGGGVVFISYYSEGHPNKEFKEKWEFMKNKSMFMEFCNLDVTESTTSIGEFIQTIDVK